MSIEAIVYVMRFSAATLGARLVLISIADNADSETFEAWPSVETIGKKAALSDRQVQRCIRKLVDIQELEILENQGRRGCHLYRILRKQGCQDVGVTRCQGDIYVKKKPEMSPEPTKEPSVQKRRSDFVGTEKNPKPSTEQLTAKFREFDKKIPTEIKILWNPETEAEKFFAHFDSNGWKIGGKTRMLSWEATVVSWAHRFIADQTRHAQRKLQMPPDKMLAALDKAIDEHRANPKHPRYALAKQIGELTPDLLQGYKDLVAKRDRYRNNLIAAA